MKKLVLSLFLSLSIYSVFSQSKPYKVRFGGADKKVMVLVQSGPINIQGIEGDEVIIEPSGENKKEFPKEAEGLRMITGGVLDNTGLGANAEIEGNTLKISIPKSRYLGTLLLKIPKNVHLYVREEAAYGESKWAISDFTGEIELKTNYSRVYLNDITGPLVANTGYGKIFVTYSKINQNSPSSISASGAIDVTLPAESKANVKMKSYYGDIFTDWDLTPIKKETKTVANSGAKTITGQYAAAAPKSNEDCDCDNQAPATAWASQPKNSDVFEGTINGGGVSIDLKSSNGNIYLRKKK